jgi:hypothetical protein
MMVTTDMAELAQAFYKAFATGDREYVEAHLSDSFTFSSPVDVGLDRAGYFERCWPGAGQGQGFEFLRLVPHDQELVVTYELEQRDGKRGRNTEILGFDGDQLVSAEVYFGWDVT